MVVVGTIALCHARKAFPFFQEFLRGCVRFCALTRGHNFLEQLRHRVGRTAGRQRRRRRRRRMIGEGTTNTIGENRENRRERLYARRELPRFKATSHTRACLPTILERRSDVDDVVVVVVVVVPFWGVWLFVTALRDDDLSSVASSSSVLSVVFVFVFVFFFFFFFFGISL